MSSNPAPVTDTLSNFNDQMATAARLIGRSKHRQAIFAFVYCGKRQIKTIAEIGKAVGISKTHVLKEGGKLAGLLLDKIPDGYKKRKEFAPRYKDILALAKNKKKLERLPTKTSPRVGIKGIKVNLTFPSLAQNARIITVDDIDSFSRLKKHRFTGTAKMLKEQKIKEGFKRIIGEKGTFKDWGGEKSDLYTTHILFRGKRIVAAVAFKGSGTKGKLVPAKMGKNGDQINRLFDEPAGLFLVVYGGQIDSSVVSQMQAFAVARAISGQKIYFGIIDGSDLGRLISAYREHF